MSELNARTREHYDSLLPQLNNSYVDYRWRSHPLQRLHYQQTRRTLRRALTRYAPHAERMLEVGCGPGTWTDNCLNHTQRLTLLDISRKMLDEAKDRYSNDERVSIVCGDFTSGVIGAVGRIDTIVSVRAIEYMSPKQEVVRQVSCLLKPGGTLIVITKNPGWRDANGEGSFGERRSDSIHSDWISWTALSRLLQQSGMEVVAVHPAAMGWYDPPFANFVGRQACHLIHRITLGFDMSAKLDPLTESYMLAARKYGGVRAP